MFALACAVLGSGVGLIVGTMIPPAIPSLDPMFRRIGAATIGVSLVFFLVSFSL